MFPLRKLFQKRTFVSVSACVIVATVLLVLSGCGSDSATSGLAQKAPGSAADGGGEPSGAVPGDTPTAVIRPIVSPTVVTAPRVVLSTISGRPGALVDLQATLSTAGTSIAGVQVDIAFSSAAAIAANHVGRPQCAVNPDINKNGTAFAFRPIPCDGTACEAVRAIVIALDSVDPIADGSVLFTCKVQIDFGAAGTFSFSANNVGFSDPDGVYISGSAVDGSVTVAGDPLPTPVPMSPTASATATPQETPTAVGSLTVPAIEVNRTQGAPGDRVQFTATLRLPNHEEVTAVQNDLCLPEGVSLAAKADGQPDCDVNPAIMKDSTSFTFQPSPYSPAPCRGVRAIVISFGTMTDPHIPIADGAVLYTCNVYLEKEAEGSLTLHLTNLVGSDAAGQRTPELIGIDGVIDVTG